MERITAPLVAKIPGNVILAIRHVEEERAREVDFISLGVKWACCAPSVAEVEHPVAEDNLASIAEK